MDSGAAPGKDTRWHDVATLKPQTTTKEEVAARTKRRKKLLFIPIPGTIESDRSGGPRRLAADSGRSLRPAARRTTPQRPRKQ